MDKLIEVIFTFVNRMVAIFLLLTGMAVFVYGMYDVVLAIISTFEFREEGKLISGVLKGVDVIFIGLVIQMLGIGLYELFVRPLDRLPDWLRFDDFDELKLILINASITVLAISFVGKAATWKGEENIVYYGIGLAAVIFALTFFIRIKKGKKISPSEKNG